MVAHADIWFSSSRLDHLLRICRDGWEFPSISPAPTGDPPEIEEPWMDFQLRRDVRARPDLTSHAKIVFEAILDRIGKNNRAWPGVRMIASDCGISRSAAGRAIQELVNSRILSCDPGKGTRTSRYFLVSRQRDTTASSVPPVGRSVPPAGRNVPNNEPSNNTTTNGRVVVAARAGGTEMTPEELRDHVDRIREAYPDNLGTADPTDAIVHAITHLMHNGHPLDAPEVLLRRVRHFAQTWEDKPRDQVQYTISWFRDPANYASDAPDAHNSTYHRTGAALRSKLQNIQFQSPHRDMDPERFLQDYERLGINPDEYDTRGNRLTPAPEAQPVPQQGSLGNWSPEEGSP